MQGRKNERNEEKGIEKREKQKSEEREKKKEKIKNTDKQRGGLRQKGGEKSKWQGKGHTHHAISRMHSTSGRAG